MSSGCLDLTCSAGCCNYFGYCPNPFGNSNYESQCYLYYDSSTTLDTGAIVGGIVGSIIAVFVVVAILMYWQRRKQQEYIVQNFGVFQANPNISILENSKNRLAINQQPTPHHVQPTPNKSTTNYPGYGGNVTFGTATNYGPVIAQSAYSQPISPIYPQLAYNQTIIMSDM